MRPGAQKGASKEAQEALKGAFTCALVAVWAGFAWDCIRARGLVLRGLNDGVSSLCGLVGALLPGYFYSAPLGVNGRQISGRYFCGGGVGLKVPLHWV